MPRLTLSECCLTFLNELNMNTGDKEGKKWAFFECDMEDTWPLQAASGEVTTAKITLAARFPLP